MRRAGASTKIDSHLRHDPLWEPRRGAALGLATVFIDVADAVPVLLVDLWGFCSAEEVNIDKLKMQTSNPQWRYMSRLWVPEASRWIGFGDVRL